MSDWFILLLMVGFVYRVTRLITVDKFPPIKFLREKIAGKENLQEWEKDPKLSWSPEWLGDLVSCYWCASGWVSIGTVLITDHYGNVPMPGLSLFAIWAAGALMVDKLG